MMSDDFIRQPVVLVADDEKEAVTILAEVLKRQGYIVKTATDGKQALEIIEEGKIDLAIIDVFMPYLSGIEICRQVKSNPRRRLLPIVMITGLGDEKDKVEALEAGTDDFLNKPFNFTELLPRLRSLLRMKFLNEQLDSAENVIYALARAIEAKDKYTQGHTERVSGYASRLGEQLKLSSKEVEALYSGGILHDIGKIGVPDAILNKPGKLTEEEFAVIKKHPLVGAEICQPLKSLRQVIPIIRHHHEKMDGSGYPDGLAGEEIPLLARIMAIVDVYDALTSERSYRRALSIDEALGILFAEADNGFWDKELLVEFSEMVRPR